MKKILLIGVVGIFICLSACNSSSSKKLPILGAREAVEKEIDGVIVIDTIYKTIPEFSFLNQDSVEITGDTFDNSIYIADFFFTSCPSICPIMHRNMLKIYEEYKGQDELKFLSHSIDFKYDTPSVLKAYADKLGISGNQWQFASGSKESIYGIAVDYMVFAAEDDQVAGGYEHQGWFILVDKDKRVRGAYDGTDDEQVSQLLKDIPVLLAEYK
jgi:protein SCO1/2